MYEIRLLKDLPSKSERSIKAWCVDHVMVDVIRVGLRLRTCVFADIAPELVWVWEDRVISSISGWTGHGSGGCCLAGPPIHLTMAAAPFVKGAADVAQSATKICEA